MPFGTTLLQTLERKKEQQAADEKAAAIRILDQHQIPTPDRAYGAECISFGYDIGGDYEVAFTWMSDEGIEFLGVNVPGGGFTHNDDISEGQRALVEMRQAELKQLLPEASENKLFVLAWLYFTNEELRVTEDARITAEESKGPVAQSNDLNLGVVRAAAFRAAAKGGIWE